MVECEYNYCKICGVAVTSFNRYMVECESILTAQQLSEILVLIDTWWNVNAEYIVVGQSVIKVLIDTWWNVNTNLERVWKR